MGEPPVCGPATTPRASDRSAVCFRRREPEYPAPPIGPGTIRVARIADGIEQRRVDISSLLHEFGNGPKRCSPRLDQIVGRRRRRPTARVARPAVRDGSRRSVAIRLHITPEAECGTERSATGMSLGSSDQSADRLNAGSKAERFSDEINRQVAEQPSRNDRAVSPGGGSSDHWPDSSSQPGAPRIDTSVIHRIPSYDLLSAAVQPSPEVSERSDMSAAPQGCTGRDDHRPASAAVSRRQPQGRPDTFTEAPCRFPRDTAVGRSSQEVRHFAGVRVLARRSLARYFRLGSESAAQVAPTRPSVPFSRWALA